MPVKDGCEIVMDIEHYKIHDGEKYISTIVTESITASATLDFIMETMSAGTYWKYNGESNVKMIASLYEDATCSSLGTTSTAINLNRDVSKTDGLNYYYNPTGCTATTLLGSRIIFGSSAKDSANIGSEEGEWVLKNNTKYLIRLQNREATVGSFSARFTHHKGA